MFDSYPYLKVFFLSLIFISCSQNSLPVPLSIHQDLFDSCVLMDNGKVSCWAGDSYRPEHQNNGKGFYKPYVIDTLSSVKKLAWGPSISALLMLRERFIVWDQTILDS